MYPESSEGLNKETNKAIYFFSPAFHALNNFSAHDVDLWGHLFLTTEHAFQWKKFSSTNSRAAEEILQARSADEAKRISEAHKESIPIHWHEERVIVMEEILRAKLLQHNDVREMLIKTGTREIYENSPTDTFWGIGVDGSGENRLGKIWMKLRDEL